MKRLVMLALLVACRSSQEEPKPVPPPPAAPSAPAAPAPSTPRRPPPPPAPLQPIAGVMPVAGDFTIKDFAFAGGEKLPELRMHYMTLGTAKRDSAGHVTNAVLIMHGTGGSGQQFARTQFADVLFGPGQTLDLTRYYVILPDDIGHGGSSKPSDGLHARFPHYNYTDMVVAKHALVTEGLKVDHLRLVMGTSMGCMHSWLWAEKWPQIMDGVMALACLPAQIVGRNRQWRKIVVNAIMRDPGWLGGEYTAQPLSGLMTAYAVTMLAGSNPLADQKRLPTPKAADDDVDDTSSAFLSSRDANDTIFQFGSSRDYSPSHDLEKITAPVVLVNSADDFINPPQLGIAEREIKRVKRGKFVLIPASESTHGHGTHTWAVFWDKELKALLDSTAKM